MFKLKNIKFTGFDNSSVYLFLNLFAILNLIFIILQFERYEVASERWDLLLFLLLGFLTIFFCITLIFNQKLLLKVNYLTIFLAFYGLFKGITTIESWDLGNWDLPFSYYLWSGFGWQVLLLSCILSFFIYEILLSDKTIFKVLRATLAIYLLSSTLLAYWQNSSSLIEVTHSNHVFNELFGIKNSKYHFSSFIPQYQSLYTFLGLFINNKTATEYVDMQLLIMYGSTLCTIFICLKLVKDSNSKFNYINSILLTFPFLVVAPIFYLRQSDLGTMATLLSAFPIRLFPSILLMYICSLSIKFYNKSFIINKKLFVLTGVFSGLNIWNNFEFALAIVATICGFLFLLHFNNKSIDVRKLITAYSQYFSSFIVGFAIVPFFYFINDIEINFNFLGWWPRQFASGFGNAKIVIPGPSMFVLSMMFILFAMHFYYLYNSEQFVNNNIEIIKNNSSKGLLISLFCIFGSPYYLNRSFASGQLQLFLFFIAVSFSILIGTILLTSNKKIYIFDSVENIKNNLVNLFLMLIISIFVSSVIISATPMYEYKRIVNSREAPNWPGDNFSKIFDEVEKYNNKNNFNPDEIGYFGDFSEIVEYKTGVKSLMFISGAIDVVNFMDLENYSKNPYLQSCELFRQFNFELIIVDNLTYERQNLDQKNLCNLYEVYDSYDAIKVLKKVNN